MSRETFDGTLRNLASSPALSITKVRMPTTYARVISVADFTGWVWMIRSEVTPWRVTRSISQSLATSNDPPREAMVSITAGCDSALTA